MPRISTPCIRVCTLDPDTGLCEGCGRTTAEITGWFRLPEEERLRIMAELPARMEALRPALEPGGGAPMSDPPAAPPDGRR